MKRILGGIADGSMDPAEANRLADACAASADLREGLAAQRERRTARFSGS